MKYISSCLYEDGGEHLAAADGYIPVYSDNMAIEALALGIVSLCLTFVNIFCIVLMGIIVLKVCLIHIGTSGYINCCFTFNYSISRIPNLIFKK